MFFVGCFSPENFQGRTSWPVTGFCRSDFNIYLITCALLKKKKNLDVITIVGL